MLIISDKWFSSTERLRIAERRGFPIEFEVVRVNFFQAEYLRRGD